MVRDSRSVSNALSVSAPAIVGLLAIVSTTRCTALATGPSWTGASMADSAPLRVAEEERELKEASLRRAREPKAIGAKHVLVMHEKSERRPESLKRTREEAKKRAEECLAKIRAGKDFDEMVLEYSDEPGSAERKGDLGVFEKKVMVKQFAEAAFALEVGQVSDIVETPFGFHIIKRTQ